MIYLFGDGGRNMELTKNAYIEASTVYETSLDEDYKKDNGIFYTDLTLSDKIISELKVPSEAIILDPCCGAGSFIYSARKRGYLNLYGADKDGSAIKFCSENISSANFVEADTLGQSVDKTLLDLGLDNRPEYIIGNPPYAPLAADEKISKDYLFCRKVADSGNNLFVAALLRALDMIAVNGIISYIIPKNFLHVSSYGNLRKEILTEKTIVSIIDIGAYFKNVRGEQIIITIKNCLPEQKHKIKIKRYFSNRFVTQTSIPQNFYTNEILLFSCREDFTIYKKLLDSYQHLSDLTGGYVGRGKSTSKNAIAGKDIRKFGYKDKNIPVGGSRIFIQNIYSAEAGIIAAFGGNLEASQTVTIFTDGDEKMCRFILGILHSRLCNLFLYKYCFNYSKLTMHTDAKYLKKIPLPTRSKQNEYFDKLLELVNALETSDYMTQEWFNELENLNQVVYQLYDISEKEANYIDSEMKKIQSKRWYLK